MKRSHVYIRRDRGGRQFYGATYLSCRRNVYKQKKKEKKCKAREYRTRTQFSEHSPPRQSSFCFTSYETRQTRRRVRSRGKERFPGTPVGTVGLAMSRFDKRVRSRCFHILESRDLLFRRFRSQSRRFRLQTETYSFACALRTCQSIVRLVYVSDAFPHRRNCKYLGWW